MSHLTSLEEKFLCITDDLPATPNEAKTEHYEALIFRALFNSDAKALREVLAKRVPEQIELGVAGDGGGFFGASPQPRYLSICLRVKCDF